jgi:hypothetical protein
MRVIRLGKRLRLRLRGGRRRVGQMWTEGKGREGRVSGKIGRR